jgi:hypothetical protein
MLFAFGSILYPCGSGTNGPNGFSGEQVLLSGFRETRAGRRPALRRPRQWPLRLVGSLFGIGAGLVGLFSLLGVADQPGLSRERAIGFGIVALVVGAVALIGSLASRDVHALWYCTPRRWRAFRSDVLAVPEPTARPGARRPLTPADDASEDRRSARSRDRW